MSLSSFLLTLKGSASSGNWGHGGRPGKRGGSSPNTKNYTPIDHDEITANYSKYNKVCAGSGDKDCKVLQDYTATSSIINDHLRLGKHNRPQVVDMVKDLDTAIENAPRLHRDSIVYRYLHKDVLSSLVPGEVFEDKGFNSTTIKRGSLGGENLEIRLPAGSKGVYVKNLSVNSREFEYLLPRNSKFRVVEKTKDSAILELVE